MINIGTRAKQKTLQSGEFRFALFTVHCLRTKNSQTWSLAIKVKPKIVALNLGFHDYLFINFSFRCQDGGTRCWYLRPRAIF
jgi:hypothetical protein